jgi:hypothetical protein
VSENSNHASSLRVTRMATEVEGTKTPIGSLDWHFALTLGHHPARRSHSSASDCVAYSASLSRPDARSRTRPPRSWCSGAGRVFSNGTSTNASGIDQQIQRTSLHSAACSPEQALCEASPRLCRCPTLCNLMPVLAHRRSARPEFPRSLSPWSRSVVRSVNASPIAP